MQIKRNKSIQYLGLEDGKQVVGDVRVGRFHSCCWWLSFLADVAPGASTNSWEGSYTTCEGLGLSPVGTPHAATAAGDSLALHHFCSIRG